jgi:hypothetical protein
MIAEAPNASEADRTIDEIVSPELALVDPELARRARAALPKAGGVRVEPRPARIDAAPTPAAPAETSAEPPPLARRRAARPVRRRLLAVAALAPVLVALALVGEFAAGRGPASEPRAASEPDGPPAVARQPRPAPARAPQQPAAGRTPSRGSDGGAARKSRPPAAQPTPSKVRSHRRTTAKPKPQSSGPAVVEQLVGRVGASASSLTRTLGTPTTSARNGQYCNVSWRRRGVTLVLVGAQAQNPCTDGHVAGGFATGHGWRTAKGLTIGAPLSQLRRRYPAARDVGSGWWKLGSVTRGRSKGPIPLHAHVVRGHVDRLLVN